MRPILLLLTIFIFACDTPKNTSQSNTGAVNTDHEAAANLLYAEPLDAKLFTKTGNQPSQDIRIALVNTAARSRQSSETILDYNHSTKKWSGRVVEIQRNLRTDEMTETAKTDLVPPQGWEPLTKELLAHHLLTVATRKTADYEQMIVDGMTSSISIQIGNQTRKVAHLNPEAHLNMYPENVHLRDYVKLKEVLENAFPVE